jgi:hypothetical protein
MAEEVNFRNEDERPPVRGTYDVVERKRVSWGSIWAGVVVAFGFWLLFALFGLFVGFAAWNPITGGGGSIWGFIWTIVTGFFALFFGAWAATRLLGSTDRGLAMLHGLATWGLAFGLVILFVGMMTTGTLQALAPAAATVAAPTVNAPGGPAGALGTTPGQVQTGAAGVAGSMWMLWLTAWLSVVSGLIGALVGAAAGRPKHPIARGGEAAPEWRRAA